MSFLNFICTVLPVKTEIQVRMEYVSIAWLNDRTFGNSSDLQSESSISCLILFPSFRVTSVSRISSMVQVIPRNFKFDQETQITFPSSFPVTRSDGIRETLQSWTYATGCGGWRVDFTAIVCSWRCKGMTQKKKVKEKLTCISYRFGPAPFAFSPFSSTEKLHSQHITRSIFRRYL